MNIPDNCRYTKDHEWIRPEGDGIYLCGITEFAQGELGDIVFIEIETVGETLEQEEVFGSIDAVKTASELFMPMTGEIIEFNEVLTDAPETVNEDPYEAGWMVKIKTDDSSHFDALMDAAEYGELVSAD